MSSSDGTNRPPSSSLPTRGRGLPRRALLFAPLALAACGFTPAYGPSGGATALRGAVQPATPATTEDFDFAARIEDRLGPATSAAYALDYSTEVTRSGVGLTAQGETTRFTLTGTVDWFLKDAATGAVLASGQDNAFTAYSATGSTVAGLTAEADARRRLMVILADRVISQLMLVSPDLPA